MSEWLTAEIYMAKLNLEAEKLGLEQEQEGGTYRIDVKFSNIGAVMDVPDADGIPLQEYSRINVFGIEYVIDYPIAKLRETLNIPK